MVRSGDQDQPSPGGTESSQETPQVPTARTPRLSARWRGASTADSRTSGARAMPADQEDARSVPHQRPLLRASLPWLKPLRPPPRRPRPSPPDFPDLPVPGQPPVPGQSSAPGQPSAPGQAAVPARPAVPFQATMPDWDTWAAHRAEMPPGAPQSSAADLRELAELGDLLGELAGLVRDLGALIMGLFTAAAGPRDQQPRAFAVPPELAELAGAHRELKAEQEALTTRYASGVADSGAPDSGDRAAMHASLAALTERATRAVAVATAVSFPAGPVPVPAPAGPVPVPAGPVPASAGPVPAPAGEGQDPAPGPAKPAETAAGEDPDSSLSPNPGPGQAAETTPASPPLGTAPRGASRPPSRDHPREESRVQMRAPVAVALDAPDIDVAAHWATLVTPYVSTVKIGLELYLWYGPAVVATVRGGSGVQVFLDLKLHDIPNTVAGAARAVAKLRPEILTVHAAGGADMIKAAVQAAPETLVAGVTLLTSIGEKDLADLGVGGSVSDAVRRMAALAVSAGARGLVCSPQEVTAVRAEVGPDVLLITPGIRPAGATSDDQARIATPVEALKAGADLLVIGRPITRAPDPGATAAAIAMSLRHAVAAR